MVMGSVERRCQDCVVSDFRTKSLILVGVGEKAGIMFNVKTAIVSASPAQSDMVWIDQPSENLFSERI